MHPIELANSTDRQEGTLPTNAKLMNQKAFKTFNQMIVSANHYTPVQLTDCFL
jgi:hypothetical protein